MRRATIRTQHENAHAVTGAISPDNTDEMTTKVDGKHVETVIERATTGGLQTSVDDYLVNLAVAERTRTHTKTDTHTSTKNTETRQ